MIFGKSGGRVHIINFDIDNFETSGISRPVVEGVFRGPGWGSINYALSENGTIVYITGGFERTIHLVDHNGISTLLNVEPKGYRYPRVSSNNSKISFTVDPRPSDIWIVDIANETARPLTSEATGHDIMSVWAPKDDSLIFFGSRSLYKAPASGIDIPHLIEIEDQKLIYPWAWSRQNQIVGVGGKTDSKNSDIFLLDIYEQTLRQFWGLARE